MKDINAYMILLYKYFKKEKTDLILELLLEDYNDRNLYFRIDYYKKDSVYKLSFIDLDHIESNNIRAWINTCNLEPSCIPHIAKIVSKYVDVETKEIKSNNHRVTLNTYFDKAQHYSFYRYVPIELSELIEVIIIIFNSTPKKLEGFFFELAAKICGNTKKFEYHDFIKFDIYKGNIDKLFEKHIALRGQKYYEENCVKFVERIGDKFYAVVDGAEEYVIIIDYDEKNKMVRLFCSCPCDFYCKHLYAVLKCIQNNEEKRFYKLMYKNNKNNNYVDTLLEANIFLCVGIERSVIRFINNEGNIEIAPLVSMDGTCSFEIIEDDDNKTISKKIEALFPEEK